MKKLLALIKKLYYDMRVRFLIVGGINFVVGYLVDIGSYALMVNFFNVSETVSQNLSPAIGTIIGAINSYFWNKYFTFKSTEKKSFKEICRFSLVYLAQYLVSIGIQALLHNVMGVNIYIAKLITIVITTLISWFGHRYFSFKVKDKGYNLKEESSHEDSLTDLEQNIEEFDIKQTEQEVENEDKSC